ncbi:MAG: VCBS repeat-containing protein [Deltaproteobacteria bacterium]|nr:VCBS repeat-containing protein [Deltaproteobacteria bacterium]
MIRVHGNYVCKKTEDWFTDVTVDVGLGPDLHRQRTVWTDIDNDGWDDVLVSTGGYDENGFSVFLNDEGDFTDITGASGVNGFGAGVALPADFDNDGNVDLYLGVNTPEQNTLDYYSTILLGDGAGQFTEVPSNGVDVMFEVNLGGETVMHRPSHVAAAAADYDGDGIVDIYTGNWEIEYPIGTAYPDQLFQGAGDGTFANVSDASGVTANKGAAYGVAWWDYDNDGDQDVATANYGGQFNYLWENQGDGTFVNASSDHNFGVAGDGKGGTSFGHDFGDIDNDGDLDAYESTIQHPRFEGVTGGSTMHLSSGAPDFDFTDVTGTLGIHRDEGEIDGSFAGFDNDGRLDLFLSDLYTGHYGRLLRQNEDGTFTDVT